MTWIEKHGKCHMDNEENVIVIGNHYDLSECEKIFEEESYDEFGDYIEPQYIYVKFGFVYFDDEIGNGWIEFDSYKKGRIKATRLITKENQKEYEDIKEEIKKSFV